jgi:RimK family alpha-L-glutamate ligase
VAEQQRSGRQARKLSRVLGLVSHRQNPTNIRLAAAAPPGIEVELVPPGEALSLLGPDDAALSRLDVMPTLDGIEPGIWEIGRLEASGIPVLNRLRAILATHDKLLTSRVLLAAGLPHPQTVHLVTAREQVEVDPPVVVKPRFGSWGRDVALCTDRAQLAETLDALSSRPWFRKQGVLVQELIPPLGHDLRVVVAGGGIVGAVRRQAADGEWRTNVALGAERQAVEPPRAALELALAAAAASGADLVGIDILPTRDGGWTVIELNGAVEFTDEYSLDRDVFEAAMEKLVASIPPREAAAVAALA